MAAMASPANSALSIAVGDGDPWDWTVEDVVNELCGPAGALRIINPQYFPEPTNFGRLIRENELWGAMILTQVNHACLKDDMGIKSIGQRGAIMHTISYLRSKSAKYRGYVQVEAASIPLPSSGLQSQYGDTLSPYHTQTYGFPVHTAPPLDRSLADAIQFPDRSTVPVMQSRSNNEDAGKRVDDSSYPRSLSPVDTRLVNPAYPTETPKIDSPRRSDSVRAETKDPEEHAPYTPCPRPFSDANELAGVETDKHSERGTALRSGEFHVVDSTGRKRRKLNLVVESSQAEISVQPDDGNFVSHAVEQSTNDEVLESTEGNLSSKEDHILPHVTGDAERGVHESSALIDHHSLVETQYVVHPPLPGEVVIDAQGRKRLIPILVQQTLSNGQTKATTPPERVASSDYVSSKQTKHAVGRAGRKPSSTYLGFRALPIDQVFYGNTAMNREIIHDDRTDTVSAFAGVTDLTRTAALVLGAAETHAEDWFLWSQDFVGNGQRNYVNNRIKHFLLSNETLPFRRKDQEFYGIIPYPARIARKHQPLSLTIILLHGRTLRAIRADRSAWLTAGDQVRVRSGVPRDGSSTTEIFDVPANNTILSNLADGEAHDWDFLEKWNYKSDGKVVLPLYGDSGSEAEYDFDTWREIEDEMNVKLERPIGPSKNHRLSAEIVLTTIEAAVEQMKEDWRTKKLLHLKHKAWRLWVKSRRDRTNRQQIEHLTANNEKLRLRLDKLRRELSVEVWSNVRQLRKQCSCLQETINDIESNTWKISILRMRHPPTKSINLERKESLKVAPSRPESLNDDEEELGTEESSPDSSDEGLEDFVVDDDPEFYDNSNVSNDFAKPDQDDGVILTDDESNLEYSDSMATPDKIADNTGSRTALAAVIQSFSEPTGGISEQHPGSEDSDTSTTNVAPDVGSDLEDVYTKQEKKPNRVKRNAPHQPPNLSNIIDLTQSSEPEDSMISLSQVNQDMMVPSPHEEVDPFQLARRVKVEFKPPPSLSNVLNNDDDTVPDEQTIGVAIVASPKHKLPEIWDIDGIANFGSKLLEERQDRKRLLTWILAHSPSEARKKARARTTDPDNSIIQYHVWKGLKTFLSHSVRMRNISAEVSEGYLQIATWYVNWHMCKYFDDKHGLPEAAIKSTLDAAASFPEYYQFLVEQLDMVELFEKEKKRTESGRAISSFPSNQQSTKQKKRLLLNDEVESTDAELPASHKKRKYAVQESQEGIDMRRSAQNRQQHRLARQKQLQTQLNQRGVSSQDPTTMIVNGKSGDEMIVINPDIGKRIQPHQLDGVQFMWGEIVLDDQEVQGCLLAHTMGLGKTMQVITLLVTIAEAARNPSESIRKQIPDSIRDSRTLILCPPSIVGNWSDEILMWTSSNAANIIGEVHQIVATLKMQERLYEIQEWDEKGGILLITYSMFRDLVLNKPRGKVGDQKPALTEQEHEKVRKSLLEGPSIIVADEAHELKTQSTAVATAVSQFKSKRRIALTGSPLANNLEEYYSIINWIAPSYLGTRPEFRYKYVEPIRDGLYKDSTTYQQRKGLKMLKVLKAELAPKVNRADLSILRTRLRGKTEFVLRVPLTPLQFDLYTLYVRHMLDATRVKEPGSATLWAWLAILRLLCNHPSCFKNKLQVRSSGLQSLKQISRVPLKNTETVAENPTALEADVDALLEGSVSRLGFSKTMVDEQLARFRQESLPTESIKLSYKMQVLMKILQLSRQAKDQVLVFSHSLDTLDYIEKLVIWSGYTYQRLDGKTKMQTRQQLTKDFNGDRGSQVCLVSTRAGGQGLNLFGANRVVIVDDSFNPMHEEQAIGRAYRMGQQKHVYVYRLTADGTFEQALTDQSLFKLQLANRVVDKKNPMRHALSGARQYLFAPVQSDRKDLSEFLGKDALVLDQILASQESDPTIRSIDLSETFQKEIEEQLTAEEEKETEQMVEDEKLRRSDPVTYEKVRARREAQRQSINAREQLQLLSQRVNPDVSVPQMAPNTGTLLGANAPQASRWASPNSVGYVPALGTALPPHSTSSGTLPFHSMSSGFLPVRSTSPRGQPYYPTVPGTLPMQSIIPGFPPQYSRTGTPLQYSRTGPPPQQLRTPGALPMYQATPRTPLQHVRTPETLPMHSTTPRTSPQHSTTPRTSPQHSTTPRTSPQHSTTPRTQLQQSTTSATLPPMNFRANRPSNESAAFIPRQAVATPDMEPVLGINTHVRSRSFSGSPDKDVSTVSDRGGTQAALRPEDTLQALISGMQAQVDGTGDLERDSSIPSSSAVALGVISASKTKSVLELSRINRIEIFRERAEQIRVILERERKRGILTQQTRHRVHNYIAHTMERHAYKNATTMDEYTQIIDVAIETMWADAESINEMVRVAGERMVDFVAKQQRKADLIVTPQTTNPSPPTEAPQSGTVAGTRTSVLQVDGPSVVSMDGTVESPFISEEKCIIC